eukprot:gene1953-1461_t
MKKLLLLLFVSFYVAVNSNLITFENTKYTLSQNVGSVLYQYNAGMFPSGYFKSSIDMSSNTKTPISFIFLEKDLLSTYFQVNKLNQFKCENNFVVPSRVASDNMIVKHDYLSTKQLKFNFDLNIKKFAMYSIFIIKCTQKETENVEIKINGKIELMNPYGYLQSESIGYYPFYGGLIILYLIFGFVWFYFILKYRSSVLNLQNWITIVLMLNIFQVSFIFFDYFLTNWLGYHSSLIILISVVLTMIKKCLSRILVLLVAMGMSTVFSDITTNKKYMITIYSFTYFIGYSIYEISRILFFYDYFTKVTLIILVIPVCLIDAIMFVWIFIELRSTINELSETKQSFKLSLYSKFKVLVFIYVLLCVNWMILNILFEFIENFQPFYYLNFVFDCFWELLYFIAFVSICYIWKPIEGNERYVESKQIADEDEDELDMMTKSQIEEESIAEDQFNIELSDQEEDTLDQQLLDNDEKKINE